MKESGAEESNGVMERGEVIKGCETSRSLDQALTSAETVEEG